MRPGAGVPAAADGVEDLDAAPTPAPCPAGAGVPCAPVRLLAAAVAVAVLGGVVLEHARALDRARRDLDRAVRSLVVSIPTGAPGPVGPPDADGWSRYRVRVPVFDRGTEPVSLAVLSLDTPHQRTRRPPPPVVLAPGLVETVVVPVAVRCADVPAPNAPVHRPAGATAVSVLVEVPGGRRVVRLRVARALHDSDPLVQQLWVACAHGDQAGR